MRSLRCDLRIRCRTFSAPARACVGCGSWRLPTASVSPSAPETTSCCRPGQSEMSSSPSRLVLSGEGSGAPMIGIAALVVGIALGLVFHPNVREVIQPYLPIAVVAALDAVFGGRRAYLA